MNYREWMQSAEALVASKLAEMGQEDVTVTIQWASRFESKMGTAQVTSHPRKEGRIRLSRPLWPKAPEAEQNETVVHELAHVLDFLKRGPEQAQVVFTRGGRIRRKKRDIHGVSWRVWMRRLGYPNPSRTHTVAAKEIGERRQAKRDSKRGGNGWMVPCNRCEAQVRMGPRQYSTARKGRRIYSHPACGGGSLNLAEARPR